MPPVSSKNPKRSVLADSGSSNAAAVYSRTPTSVEKNTTKAQTYSIDRVEEVTAEVNTVAPLLFSSFLLSAGAEGGRAFMGMNFPTIPIIIEDRSEATKSRRPKALSPNIDIPTALMRNGALGIQEKVRTRVSSSPSILPRV